MWGTVQQRCLYKQIHCSGNSSRTTPNYNSLVHGLVLNICQVQLSTWFILNICTVQLGIHGLVLNKCTVCLVHGLVLTICTVQLGTWLGPKYMITRLLERFAPIFYLKCEHVLVVYFLKQRRTKFFGFLK